MDYEGRKRGGERNINIRNFPRWENIKRKGNAKMGQTKDKDENPLLDNRQLRDKCVGKYEVLENSNVCYHWCYWIDGYTYGTKLHNGKL